MSDTITAYIGKENIVTITLKQDGATVEPDAITRAMFKFGEYCLDTSVLTDPIELNSNKTAINLQIGLLPGIVQGSYVGKLTIFDPEIVNGKAWGDSITVYVLPWETCS
jgi:hypothetical protein